MEMMKEREYPMNGEEEKSQKNKLNQKGTEQKEKNNASEQQRRQQQQKGTMINSDKRCCNY